MRLSGWGRSAGSRQARPEEGRGPLPRVWGFARAGGGCRWARAGGHQGTALGPGHPLPGCPRSPSTGVWAQIRLVESGGGLQPPGGSVLLSCHGSGSEFKDYAFHWYRQAPGGHLEWVSTIWLGSPTRFGAAVEGRADASRDNSRSESSLSLRALRPQDSARYYCSVDTETGKPAQL